MRGLLGRIFIATEKVFLVFPTGMVEELRWGIPSARCDGRDAGEPPMDRGRLTSIFFAGRRLACIIAVVALAGCAATRSDVINTSSGPATARVSELDGDQSKIQLVSAEQLAHAPPEALPTPPAAELTD